MSVRLWSKTEKEPDAEGWVEHLFCDTGKDTYYTTISMSSVELSHVRDDPVLMMKWMSDKIGMALRILSAFIKGGEDA